MSLSAESSGAPAVLVQGLWKSFPRRRPLREALRSPFARRERVEALRGVDLEVGGGEIVGLLGPNGAGKTTLLKTLCGLVLPERGQASVLGVPVGDRRLSRVLGLVHGEERSFYWRLTARENLQFYARLHGIPRGEREALIDGLLHRVRLDADAERRFGDFSSGMRQRLAVARALLADPPVLLMDEPTRSLDPVSASELRAWIGDELQGRDGKTILIATHNLHEAETLCRRVVVLSRGRLRADGSPEQLRRRGLGGQHYRVTITGPAPELLTSARCLESSSEQGGTRLLVQLGPAGLDGLLRELMESGRRVERCEPIVPDLEVVFQRLVREPEGGQSP